MSRRTLPKWNPERCDGCSALPLGSEALRRRVNTWLFRDHPEATVACEAHDEAYYYGGSEADRLAADDALVEAWKAAGVSAFVRTLGYRAIRLFGGPGARTPGVSWAFGGEYFQYSDEPAVPEDEGATDPAGPADG